MSSSFQPTGVNSSGLTALIQNLGRDCTPSQFMREFVKNAFEACQRAGVNGRVEVDFNDLFSHPRVSIRSHLRTPAME